MNKIAIIIPSRLDAVRFPNKPLKLINNKEMILHVYEAAKKSNTGEVFVATPDQKIIDLIMIVLIFFIIIYLPDKLFIFANGIIVIENISCSSGSIPTSL